MRKTNSTLQGESDYWRIKSINADAKLESAQHRIAELELQYENRSPTQWAYEQACVALEKHRKRADAAEAELARRDAAAGEPVGVVSSNGWIDEDSRGEHFWVEWASDRFPEKGTKLFTAAQPSALPPEYALTVDFNDYHLGWNSCLNAAKELGCKAIKLPKIKHHDCVDFAEYEQSLIEALKSSGFAVDFED